VAVLVTFDRVGLAGVFERILQQNQLAVIELASQGRIVEQLFCLFNLGVFFP